jgi:hypothetical protein
MFCRLFGGFVGKLPLFWGLQAGLSSICIWFFAIGGRFWKIFWDRILVAIRLSRTNCITQEVTFF